MPESSSTESPGHTCDSEARVIIKQRAERRLLMPAVSAQRPREAPSVSTELAESPARQPPQPAGIDNPQRHSDGQHDHRTGSFTTINQITHRHINGNPWIKMFIKVSACLMNCPIHQARPRGAIREWQGGQSRAARAIQDTRKDTT